MPHNSNLASVYYAEDDTRVNAPALGQAINNAIDAMTCDVPASIYYAGDMKCRW
jgi:hypothetical protein